MFTLIAILIGLVSVIMILVVLMQNSKGGGLVSNFSSANQVLGVRKTTDFLEKTTWTLAGALLVLCIMASAFIPRDEVETSASKIQQQVDELPDPFQVPESTAPVAE